MPAKTRKATFNLHEEVLAALDEAVSRGAAPSKNAFVDHALRKELKTVRQQIMAAAWKEAAQDPHFMLDVREVEDAFAEADAETARRIR